MSARSGPLADAYAACADLARSHYENFPVASRLLPPAVRPHVAALYAFARVADDIADEGDASGEERRARLQEWQDRLHRAVRDPASAPAADRDGRIVCAIAHSIRSVDLPLGLFDDLISAFGQDTMVTRYDSWCEVVDYCRRSANPIGRLVLRMAGYHDATLDQSSDALCTALQLTNFWQDFGRDWRHGRLYVPAEVVSRTGACERDLVAGRLDERWARAIEACVSFTADRFAAGRAVCDQVGGRLRIELRLTWLGGMRVLRQVARARFELLSRRPTIGIGDAPPILWRALTWSGAAPDLALENGRRGRRLP